MLAFSLRIPFFVIVLICLFQLTSAHAQALHLDKVIAVVNDEAITLSEYQTRWRREQLERTRNITEVPTNIDPEVLNELIDERIQVQLADAQGIVIPEQEIQQTLAVMAEQNGLSVASMYDQLNAQGISPNQFSRSVEEQRKIQRLVDLNVNSRVSVSDQEIDYHLQSHKELYSPDESYELSHLFISSATQSDSDGQNILENVEVLHNRLEQGLDFKNAVIDYSDGENSDTGGYLGWRQEDQLPELFLKELRDTPIGGITGIMQSSNGYHILKIHAKEGDLKIVTQNLVRHILVQPLRRELTDDETISILQELRRQLSEGADFDQLARLNSDDEASATQGGSLGWINPGDAAPAIEKMANNLPLNQLSDPFRSAFGYHIIEVLDRRKKDISFELARKKAQSEIYKRKASEYYQGWFDLLRDGAYIRLIENGS